MAREAKFKVGDPVIYFGKPATVTGRDDGTESFIVEYCDWRDGKSVTARETDLIIDQASLDEFDAINERLGIRKRTS